MTRGLGAQVPALLDEVRHLASLSLPVLLTQLAQRAVGMTDVVMLATYDSDALGASALALSVYYGFVFLCLGPTTAFTVEVARSVGEGKLDNAMLTRLVRTGLLVAILTSVPAMLSLQFTRPFLAFLREPAGLLTSAGTFAATLGVSLPFVLGTEVLRNYATTLGRPMLSLVAVLVAVAVNALGDYLLIFGRLGLPKWGLWGCALASVLSSAAAFTMTAILIARAPSLRLSYFLAEPFEIDCVLLGRLLCLGIPMGGGLLFEVLFFTSGALILGHFGPAMLAAHQIANTITATLFLVPLSLGAAATIRFAMATGARDGRWARRVTSAVLLTGLSFGTLSAIALLLLPARLAGFWVGEGVPEQREVLQNAVTFLYFAAAFQILDGAQVIANSLLRALQDTFVPMLLAGACYWLLGFPAALGLSFLAALGGSGVWLAYTLALLAAAIVLWARFLWRVRRVQHSGECTLSSV